LNGNLDSNELLRIKNLLQLAQDRNMDVIIDLHNYCRYKLNGTDEIIGSNNLTISNIKDLWTKLSLELKNIPNIWGYGIMNEPHDLLASATWYNIAQEIILGIRINDTRWLTVLDNFLNHLKNNCINGTYWAGGPWWGDYILSDI